MPAILSDVLTYLVCALLAGPLSVGHLLTSEEARLALSSLATSAMVGVVSYDYLRHHGTD